MNKAVKKAVTPAMYDVIRAPVITEKSQGHSEANKVVFRVSPCATKEKVKQAVEALFGVSVVKVNVLNRKGKTRKFRGIAGKLNDQKRAIVTVAKGQQIDISSTL